MTVVRRLRRPGPAAAALALLLASASCGGDSTGPKPDPTPRLVELWLESGIGAAVRLTADTVERGETRFLTAHGRLSTGQTVAVDSADWVVSDPAVLAPVPLRNESRTDVHTVHEGTASVTASAGGLHAEVRYVVQRAVALSISLTTTGLGPVAGPDSVVVGTPRRYSAEVRSRFVPIADAQVTWTSSDTAVATVDADGALTPRALGTTTLAVAAENARTSLSVVVRPPRAARLAFTYAPDSLVQRRTDSVRAVLYDSAGAPTAVRPRITVVGSSDLRDGQFQATYPVGTVELIASGDGLEARRTVRILPVPPGPPGVFPAATAAVVGGPAVALATRPQDADGYARSDVPAPLPTFTSDDPDVATVSAAGVVTARAPGTTVVRVRDGAAETVVPVTAIATSAFTVEFRPAKGTAPLPAAVDGALRAAADAWARVIVGDLQDLRLTLPARACDAAIAEEVTIDDVLVLASADSIDGPGGILAQAGPCVIRADGTAAVGRVYVDSADVTRLTGTGRLTDVLRHEMGHVFGIGTLWSRPALGFVRQAGGGWGYYGPRGLGVGHWWGRPADGLPGGVPLGEAGAPGTGHWAEEAFSSELMTPFLDAGANPLSLLTVEALADLGYLTSAAAAESYALYTPAPAARVSPNRGPAVGAPRAPFDAVLLPRWRVGAGGRVLALPAAPR